MKRIAASLRWYTHAIPHTACPRGILLNSPAYATSVHRYQSTNMDLSRLTPAEALEIVKQLQARHPEVLNSVLSTANKPTSAAAGVPSLAPSDIASNLSAQAAATAGSSAEVASGSTAGSSGVAPSAAAAAAPAAVPAAIQAKKRSRPADTYSEASGRESGSGTPTGGTAGLGPWSLGAHAAAALVLDPQANTPPSARGFDITRHRLRHVALHFAYVGEGYYGYASQDAGGGDVGGTGATATAAPKKAASPEVLDPRTLAPTIETVLFAALRKGCLVEDREGCGYTRCGRTDRGVSAAGQVISIRLRSKALRRDIPGVSPSSIEGSWSSAIEDRGVVPTAGGAGATDTAAGATASTGAAAATGPSDMAVEGPGSESSSESPSSTPAWSRADGLVNTGEPFPPAFPPEEGDAAASGATGASSASASAPGPRPKYQLPSLETDYALVLNNLLPPDIRVLGWCDVPEDFSARFSATTRSYRYFFPRRELDITAMRAAAAVLVGRHDFRNVCKIDIGNTQNFVRDLLSLRIVRVSGAGNGVGGMGITGPWPWGGADGQGSAAAAHDGTSAVPRFGGPGVALSCTTSTAAVAHGVGLGLLDTGVPANGPSAGSTPASVPRLFSPAWRSAVSASDAALDTAAPPCPSDLYTLEVVGTAFLWHQVRCLAALLFLAGRGLETPDTIRALLNPSLVPSRPIYRMASEGPLQLFHCGFGEERGLRGEVMARMAGGSASGPSAAGAAAPSSASAAPALPDVVLAEDGGDNSNGDGGAVPGGLPTGDDGDEDGSGGLTPSTGVSDTGIIGWDEDEKPVDPRDGDPTRPKRFLRSYPTLYPGLGTSVQALRKLTVELERQWAGHAIAAAQVRGVLDRLYATHVDHGEIKRVLAEEARKAQGRAGGKGPAGATRPGQGKAGAASGSSAAQPIRTWGQAVSAYGTPLVSTADCEYLIHGGQPAYVPLLSRSRVKGVEQRWAELKPHEREGIKARHRVNAAALDAKVRGGDTPTPTAGGADTATPAASSSDSTATPAAARLAEVGGQDKGQET